MLKCLEEDFGFTGGTADKLEAIPGYITEVNIDTFIENIEKVGISIITQTMNLAPADKKIYALRDTISCVDSIPLIASSIMSKKIASGANKIVLDVTVGSGAFMKDIENARKLSMEMISIGKLANRETICVLTNMDEPLGYAVGNTLEVIEAVEFLKGNMPEDLKEVVFELGAYMIKLSGKSDNICENKKMMQEVINNGKAYQKLKEVIENQGGDFSYIEDTSKFTKANYIVEIKSNKEGYIKSINAEEIGKLASRLGAGRMKKEDKIDMAVGIVIKKKVSEFVKKDEVIAVAHINDEEKIEDTINKILKIYEIKSNEIEKPKSILEIIEN